MLQNSPKYTVLAFWQLDVMGTKAAQLAKKVYFRVMDLYKDSCI